ncbi:SlyX family protein [Arsenicitalea aurantiaca]|uniref:Protein SlyX homolog n=1 Tax=Arsenicitalea aurantiaca TaxID=1783274 RepID=A0A433XM77_9HYPH|nr:SlyX family protein [Arsenicitalea aurantiaca]RUT35114.1 SlyX family protein [Arsenicitalea aurantiaca]
MTERDSLDERIATLETHIAYQDQTIEDLSAALAAQWKAIDALQRRLDRLVEDIAEAELAARDGTRTEPPPPHY